MEPKIKLYRKRIVADADYRYYTNPLATHLVSLEAEINGNRYVCEPMAIEVFRLREVVEWFKHKLEEKALSD